MADANALVLSVSADTSKALKELERLNKKLDALNDNTERVSRKTKASLDGFFGRPGQAIDKIFDSTRFKVLDSGAARIGLFGSSLEKLGVAGLGAAAAIGGVAFALNQAGKALAFTDELEDTAKRLHVTTDALQEYRYAIRAAGGEEAGADDALKSFSETLGKAQAGLPKAIRAFKELGFTDAQIKAFGDTGETLEKVVAKIGALKSPAQKDAIVQQLGLTGIQELAEGGVEQLRNLREEAHKAGAVMDADLIRRASGLHDEIETINKRIDIDMKSAFVSLGPVLKSLISDLAVLLEGVLRIIDAFKSVQDRSRQTLTTDAASAQAQNAAMLKRAGVSSASQLSPSQRTVFAHNEAVAANSHAELNKRAAADAAATAADIAARKRSGTSLISQARAGGGPSAQSQLKHFDDEMAKIADKALAALDNERHSLEERSKIAAQRLESEIQARDTSIDDQVATKAITAKQGERLKAENGRLANIERAELNDRLVQQQQELELRNQQAISGAVADVLNAQLGLAHTAEERAALEEQILTAQRAMARAFLAQQLQNDPNKTPFQKSVELGLFDRATDTLKASQAAKASDDIAAQSRSVAQAQLQSQLDSLQISDQLAETQAEHRRIALRRLDLQEQLERLDLEGVLASKTATDAEKKIAQIRLDQISRDHPGAEDAAKGTTRGPLEDFTHSLALDADKLNERLQEVKVRGLQGLEDGLVGVISHTEKLGDVFRNVANQIIADLARIAIEQAIIGPLTSGLSSIPGFSSIFGGHRASGGPVVPGRVYMVGERGPEPFIPSVPGTIIPNSAVRAAASMASGGTSVTVVSPVHIHAEGSVGFKELVSGINGRIDASHSAAVRTAVSIASRALPGRAQQAGRLGT